MSQKAIRPPAPVLFVRPPSHDASSPRSRTNTASKASPPTSSAAAGSPPAFAPPTASELRGQPAPRTESQWAEMQNTLNDVELSAGRGGNIFGAEHARALEGLRAAQVELAKAWGRGEADGNTGPGADGSVDLEGESKGIGGGSVEGKAGGRGLEEETENDIAAAKRRREANDRYFERVSASIGDVVARLDGVAERMRAVESEAAEVWGRGSVSSGSASVSSGEDKGL